ncbi:ATP-binding protein [Actinoallomurus iriomotensis]|uniref:ATP-binding protein n=1 Tax=Actinoallomurus iriomotensis TaxID=478107 RepID=UPI002552D40A|nr:LuxR family transcriptional regulator [Actinoallomurus iriomotensis]
MDQSVSRARLHQRSAGLRAIDRLLHALREGGGGALFLTGDTGLGKTTLLDLAAHRAGPWVKVARARGQAMEVELRLGLAAQALEPLGGLRLGPSAIAAEPAESRVAVWLRARAWLETTASTTPVLLLLDDLHWSDPDSLELIAFLSRRIREVPVGIIAGLRPWPPAARELVDQLVADGTADSVELAPLSRPGAQLMLAELLSRQSEHRVRVDGPDGGDLASRAWTLAGGNPFLIEQLAKIVVSEGGLPEPEGIDLGEFRRVLLLSTFAALPSQAIEYARAASVLGSEFRLALVPPVASLDPEQAADGLEALFGNGLLTETRRGWAAFAHPLVARAVYEDLSPVRRIRLHARAFERLAGLGEVSLAAHHAVAADLVGDPAAIAAVTAAGDASMGAGAVRRAVEHLQAAVELCAGEVPGMLWLRLGEAWLAAGQPAQAAECCRSAASAADLVGAPRVRALRLLARAMAFASDIPSSGRAAEEALEYARASAPETVGSVIVEQVHAVWQSSGPAPASVLIDALYGERELRDAGLRAMRSFVNYYAHADAGALDELSALVGDDTDLNIGEDQNSPFDPTLLYLSIACLSERFDDEERVRGRARERAAARGLIHAQLALDISKVDSLLRQGRLTEARGVLDDCGRVADVVPLMHETIDLSRAALACECGDTGRARALLTAAGTPHLMWMSRVWAAHLEALIRLNDEDTDAASAGYLDLERLIDELGVRDPCVVPWAPFAIRAHLRSDRLEDAERVCGRVEAVMHDLPGMWPRLTASAGRAGLAAARGDRRSALALYTEAVALPVPLPLERARVLLDSGSWLRRVNQPLAAREHLAEALEIAERAGAVGLAARAAAELRVAGGRRRSRREPRGQLTAQETRVASLASQGLTNAEVAHQLSLSVKTIETHLTRIYRKLSVRSKRELRAHLPRPEPADHWSGLG